MYSSNTLNTSVDSRSVLLSVADDWKNFALNNRRVSKDVDDSSSSYNAK